MQERQIIEGFNAFCTCGTLSCHEKVKSRDFYCKGIGINAVPHWVCERECLASVSGSAESKNVLTFYLSLH